MSKPELHINVDAAHEDHGVEVDENDDDMYSDESSAEGEIDPDIDFNVMYALHTFVATVDGQASVVKGDSMVLLDDSNSYWWLVNVLKADEVGYIPAENIETPNDRLARLNKSRNVEIAASTAEEKNLGRLKLRNIPSESGHGGRPRSTISTAEVDPNRRGVKFGEPTYVEHSGSDEDWSSEEESEEEEGDFLSGSEPHNEVEDSDDDLGIDQGEPSRRVENRSEGGPLLGEDGASYEEHGGVHGMMMEPDDGMSWEDDAGDAQARDSFADADPDTSLASRTDYWDGLQPIASDSSHQSLQSSAPSHRSQHSMASDGSLDDPTLTGAPPATDPASPARQPAPAGSLYTSDATSRAKSPVGPSSDLGHSPSPYGGNQAYTASSQQSLSSYAREQLLDQALEHPEETRRISATPAVARRAPLSSFMTGEPYDLDEAPAATNTMPRNFSATSLRSDGADSLDSSRKDSFDRTSPGQARTSDDKGKKKAGVFGSLFKKKGGDKKGSRSPGGGDGESNARSSDEDTTSRPQSAVPTSPVGPRPGSSASLGGEQKRALVPSPPPGNGPASPSVSPHALRLQQQDQKVQAAYQRYLTQTTRASAEVSPASLSYGTQAAATVAQSSSAARVARASLQLNRPASLLISNQALAAPGGGTAEHAAGVAPGSFAVLRVFAGEAVESDATFKTVLLKDSTTTAELLKQAMQRFGLGLGRDDAHREYSLTVKGFDGDETVLGLDGHPLVVFNEMTRDDAVHAPLVRQSSIGSINSVASNLTLNPAISRLGDWSDDSVVKLYIHRNLGAAAPTSAAASPRLAGVDTLANEPLSPFVPASAAVAAASGRFTLQIVVQPQDLPEGMSFDPSSDALLAARRRSSQFSVAGSSAPTSPNPSQTERRRLFLLPANTTVAEAIEGSLDRFGIAEGVVDGGDVVEDKLSNRKSITRVRYGLAVRIGNQERMLQPSAKLLDVYERPPTFRALPGPTDLAARRRSREIPEARVEDLSLADPVFVLRKAPLRETPSGSTSSRRRSRLSATLDPDGVGLYRRQGGAKDGADPAAAERLSASSELSRLSSLSGLAQGEGEGEGEGTAGSQPGSGESERTVTLDAAEPPTVEGLTTTTPLPPAALGRELAADRADAGSQQQHRPQQASVSSSATSTDRSRSTPDSSALARSQTLCTPAPTHPPSSSSRQQTPNPAPTTPLTTVPSRGPSRVDEHDGGAGGGRPTTTSNRPPTVGTHDDFGIGAMLAVVRARARSSSSRQPSAPTPAAPDMIDRLLFPSPLADGGPAYPGKRARVELQGRLDELDKELDRALEGVLALARRERQTQAQTQRA